MIKRLKKLKDNNSGAALVLVLLVVAFVSMLVSILFVAILSNTNMKKNEQLGDNNFQVTDSAIEELTMGLEEIADGAMREAFTYMLQVYTQTVQNQRFDLLKSQFSQKMADKIKKNDASNSVDLDKLKKLISKASNGTVVLDASVGTDPIYNIDSDLSVVIKNVKLNYKDNLGYETTITTDIRFRVPSEFAEGDNVKDSINFSTFGIITNASVENTVATELPFVINANVYAGKNISAVASKLKLNGDLTIVEGTLQSVNAGYVELSNETSGALWAGNIATNTSGSFVPVASENLWLSIKCNAMVADDLTLNANYSNVKFFNNYYGYHTANSNGTAADSSAILINGKNTKLEFLANNTNGAKNQVVIAGKAYISVPNYELPLSASELVNYGLERGQYGSFMMGESISFKGVQNSYMVPGDCIIGINHNPMTLQEYETKLLTGVAKVNLGQNIKSGGVDLLQYVKEGTGYKTQFVKYVTGAGTAQTMVYLYLDFTSADKASDYFAEYYKKYDIRVKALAKYLDLGDIIMGAEYINTGNMIIKEEDELTLTTRGKYGQSHPTIVEKELSFARTYNGLRTFLDPSYFTNDTSKRAGDNLIHFKTSTSDCAGLSTAGFSYTLLEGTDDFTISDDDVHHDPDATEHHPLVLITTNDVELSNENGKFKIVLKNGGAIVGEPAYVSSSMPDGLILTSKSITLNGVNFNGLLISDGDIYLKGTSTITNVAFPNAKYAYKPEENDGSWRDSDDYINNIEELIKHDANIYKWFKTYSPFAADGGDDYYKKSVNIIFENWQKNN